MNVFRAMFITGISILAVLLIELAAREVLS